ncbi:MAG: hypothetical protein WBI04_02610 [Trichlorobacter sp.]
MTGFAADKTFAVVSFFAGSGDGAGGFFVTGFEAAFADGLGADFAGAAADTLAGAVF